MPIPGDPLPISPALWTDLNTGRPTDNFYQYIFKLDAFLASNIARLNAAVFGVTPAFFALLRTLTASSSASLDDTTSITPTYDLYMITYANIVPATNNAGFLMRFQVSGTFQTTSYLSSTWVSNSSGTSGAEGTTNGIPLSGQAVSVGGIDNTGGLGASGISWLFGPNGTSNNKHARGFCDWVNTAIEFGGMCGGYYNGSQAAVTGLRFLMTSGNIAQGIVRIYGIKTS